MRFKKISDSKLFNSSV